MFEALETSLTCRYFVLHSSWFEREVSLDYIKQMRKGIAEMCVLAVLRQGDTYGYDLVVRLSSLEALTLNQNTVYPLLSRLRKAGHVTVYEKASPEGPARRYFTLTLEGKMRLAGMETFWRQMRVEVDELIEAKK